MWLVSYDFTLWENSAITLARKAQPIDKSAPLRPMTFAAAEISQKNRQATTSPSFGFAGFQSQ